MKLLSVNVGVLRPIKDDEEAWTTGIYKLPVAGAVELGPEGLAGDVIVAKQHHGGPDQAVYIYGQPDYAWWARELGRELVPGQFGDNLTIAGYESAASRVGDRFHIGDDVVLEVTAPRIPCSTFAARMGDERFPPRFRAAERPGAYCRVIRGGTVQAGDAVRYAATTADTVTILEMFRDYYAPEKTPEAIARFLAAPIAARERKRKEKQLRELARRDPG